MNSKVVMDLGTVRVDANPEDLGEMVDRMIADKKFRRQFEEDPVAVLRSRGVHLPEEMAKDITPETIDLAIENMTEGSDARQVNVAVGVRVGTRPGTRPGVRVGVRVATGTSTFATAETEKETLAREIKELKLND